MFNQFNPNTQHQPAVELIPNGVLAFAVVEVQGVKISQNGGRYASLKLTIDRGPYERRTIFSMVGDPTDPNNSEKYQQMSMGALQHMLEAAGIFRLDDPNSYATFANSTFEQVMAALDGKTVAIKIKIEKGRDGYEDKNAVADWLSPNPNSRSYKKWQELVNPTPATPGAPALAHPPAGGQAAPARPQQATAPAPGGKPAWLNT